MSDKLSWLSVAAEVGVLDAIIDVCGAVIGILG